MNRVHATVELSRLTRAFVSSLPGCEVAPYLAAWPLEASPLEAWPSEMAARTAVPMHGGGTCAEPPLPVLRWLPRPGTVTGLAANLIDCLFEAAPSLAWRQTYGLADIDAGFLENYGYTELVGPTAPLPSAQMACGFLLLGPQTLYPRHRHEAEEVYVTVSGNAQWLQGDETWRAQPRGRLIHHGSEEAHAIKTGNQPLLALYLWRGENLGRKARLVAAETSTA